MTTPIKPTREQVEAYWYNNAPKPLNYDYYYTLEDNQECPKCGLVDEDCDCE